MHCDVLHLDGGFRRALSEDGKQMRDYMVCSDYAF
jgi:hypothetical protein